MTAARATVAVACCQDYEPGNVERALKQCLEHLGGVGRWVEEAQPPSTGPPGSRSQPCSGRPARGSRQAGLPGKRLLLKISHLGDHPPEEAVIVHPNVTQALAELLKQAGAQVTVGDGLDRPGLEGFRRSGTLSAAEDAGVQLTNFKGSPYPSVPVRGRFLTQVPVAEAVREADVVVNLAKMKTHVLTLLTGAIKNTYGYLPEGLRSNLHRTYVSPPDFAQALLDVFQTRPPDLNVVDAVVALEGYGPSRGGTPKQVGLIVASEDAVALDAVLGALMGYGAGEVVTTRVAGERGLGVDDLGRIDILGPALEEVRPADFALPERTRRGGRLLAGLPRPLLRICRGLSQATTAVPEVVKGACIGCGLCVRHCPTGAAEMRPEEKRARIDRNLCISCFCCQEFCESDAIRLTHRPIGAMVLSTERVLRALRHGIRFLHRSLRRKPSCPSGATPP